MLSGKGRDSMGYDGSLKFDTEISEKGFNSGLKKIGGIAKSVLSVATKAIAGVAAALKVGTVAGIKYNASIETYQTSFEVMTGSAEKAAEVVERLKKVGAETPFELPELADTTQLLMNYGFTADEAMDKMMMLGDISQGSADKMTRIATAYGQMSSAGKVSLEDVKQMIEAGFNPLQEISESTGESMSSLYDRISKGTLTVDEITASMQRATAEGGKYYQSMEKQSQTINGMISTLKDNAQQLLGEVVQPITESFATTLLPAAIDAIDQLTTAFQEEGVDGLISAGGQIVTNLLLGIAQGLPGLIETAAQVIQNLVSNITLNLPQFLSAGGQIVVSLVTGIAQVLYLVGQLGLNIIATLISGIAANAPQLMTEANNLLWNFRDQIQSNLPQILQSGADIISNLLNGILSNAPQVIAQVTDMTQTYLQIILSSLPSILDSGSQIISNLLAGIERNAPKIFNQVSVMMSRYINTILNNLPAILDSGVNLILNLLNGIVKTAPQVISQAGVLIVNVASTIASHLPEILQKGIELIGKLLAGIIQAVPQIIGAIPGIVSQIGRAFLNTDWGSIGANIIRGIANGITGAVGSIVSAAVNAAKSAFNAAKNFLGINSPSRLFRDQIGKYMALGMGVGFEQNIPVEDMNRSVGDAITKLQTAAAGITKRTPVTATELTKTVTNNYTQAGVDYKKVKEAQLEAMNEANERPIRLNGREVRRGLKGTVVTA